MEPHITLLAPDHPLLEPGEARATFTTLELGIAPFRISAHRLHRFSRHHRHTVVLAPDNPVPLTHLFNTLITSCTWQETMASARRSYQPHITLVNQVPEDRLKNIERQLEAIKPTINFECRELVLYAKQTRWPAWQELARLSLGEKQHFDRHN